LFLSLQVGTHLLRNSQGKWEMGKTPAKFCKIQNSGENEKALLFSFLVLELPWQPKKPRNEAEA